MPVDRATVIRNFYVTRLPDGSESDQAEDDFCDIEAEAGASMKILIDERAWPIPDTARASIATWAALQYLRVPAIRHLAREIAGAYIEAGVPFTTDAGEQTNLWMPADEADPEKIKRLHLEFIRKNTPVAARMLYARDWHLTFFTRKTLVTGDSPVVLRPMLRHPARTSVALGNAAEVQVPLGRRPALVLTNPPFGVRGSVTYSADDKRVASEDLTYARPDFWVETANKQLNFLQHVLSLLTEGVRAAVVVPDNVLYESGAASTVRRRLLEDCNVHTLLRLPAGLFYAQGVKSNVLFLRKEKGNADRKLWVYDLRTGNRFSLKSRPLREADLEEFVSLYASDSQLESRKESPDSCRWKSFACEELLASPDCNLDLKWNPEDSPSEHKPSRLDELSELITADLQRALVHIAKASGKNGDDPSGGLS